MFDAKKALDANVPPQFKCVDGTVITGEMTTVKNVLYIRARLFGGAMSFEEMQDFVPEVCNMIKMEAAIPHILELPVNDQFECLLDFFVYLKGQKGETK